MTGNVIVAGLLLPVFVMGVVHGRRTTAPWWYRR